MTSRTQHHNDQPPRRRLSAYERRREILDSAQDVFAARGYHGSSIDEIAHAAGISKALIYEHFPSKKDLHASLLDMHVEELVERLTASAATEDPGETRLRNGIDAFFGWVEERRVAFRMVFRDAVDPEVADVLRRILDQTTGAVTALMATEPVSRGSEREGLRGVHMMAQQLTGAMQALALWWDENTDVPRDAVVDVAMDFCWVGLERVVAGERSRGARARANPRS